MKKIPVLTIKLLVLVTLVIFSPTWVKADDIKPVTINIEANYSLECGSPSKPATQEMNATLTVTIPGDQFVESKNADIPLSNKDKKGPVKVQFIFTPNPQADANESRDVFLQASQLKLAGNESIKPTTRSVKIGSIALKTGVYTDLTSGNAVKFNYEKCPPTSYELMLENDLKSTEINFRGLCKDNITEATNKAKEVGVNFTYELEDSCVQPAKACVKAKQTIDATEKTNCINPKLQVLRQAYYNSYRQKISTDLVTVCNSKFGTDLTNGPRRKCSDENDFNKCLPKLTESGSFLGYNEALSKCKEPIEVLAKTQPATCDLKVDSKEPDLPEACTQCIAGFRRDSIKFIREDQGGESKHKSCSDQQIVNYMCKGGISERNKGECLAVTKDEACQKVCGNVSVTATDTDSTRVSNSQVTTGVGATNPDAKPAAPAGQPAGAAGNQPGRGANANGGVAPAKPDQAKKPGRQISTKIIAHVNGLSETSTENRLETQDDQVMVGARVIPKDGGDLDCIVDSVDLKWEKEGSDEVLTIKSDDEEKGKTIYQNCRSYAAPVKGNGRYILTASYPGYPEGDDYYDKDGIHYNAGQLVQVEVIIDGPGGTVRQIPTESAFKVRTRVATGVQSTRLSAKKPAKGFWNTQIAWSKLFKKPNKEVAGIKAETQGDGTMVISSDKSSGDKLILTPETTVNNGALDTDQIPVIHVIVTEILNDGSARPLIDNANYPNGEPLIFSEEDLGDLSQVNRLEAGISYQDPGSAYESSQGDLVINVSNNKVEENPWVTLSSNPAADLISAGNTAVAITASSNKEVQDPVFKVTHDGQTENPPVMSGTNNCADGAGSCEYTTTLYMPNGDYKVEFESNGVAAEPLTFTTKTAEEQNPEADNIVERREILYQGNTYEVPAYGSVPIDLQPGENTLEQVTYYLSGRVEPESFTVIVESEQVNPSEQPEGEQFGPTPAPFESTEDSSRLKWYCGEGEVIMQVENGNNAPYRDCAAEGKRCVPITTAGYESDADCVSSEQTSTESTPAEQAPESSPEQAAEPQQSSLKWYCEGTVIMQDENGTVTSYHDCNDEGYSCRAINTPGYESDAECYLPE